MNTHFSEILTKMAVLFSYPQKEYLPAAQELKKMLSPEQREQSKEFFAYLENAPFTDVEEHFTKTFDMNPNTCLEVGWHMFGEDYKRGQFLVYMRQSLSSRNIPESVELPDHLSHCLRLLAVLPDDEAQTYAQSYLVKPLKKIIANLEENNPYAGLLQLLLDLIKQELNVKEVNETSPRRAVSFMEK